ncbi:hypothetical protein T4E_11203 [Trichinella pseudospiralis]|uniref:Uncharacterized protein n=1 Tax=Trichinella pseudospiralis TaxID=6337 RepID=A0A0V0Y3U7_TRIPS|nr:hypothetical protein T4E_11203 [Trichinella pseudospiralis]
MVDYMHTFTDVHTMDKINLNTESSAESRATKRRGIFSGRPYEQPGYMAYTNSCADGVEESATGTIFNENQGDRHRVSQERCRSL